MTQSPPMTLGAVESKPEPPPLLVERDLRRGRLSVAFRLLLALPQLVFLYLLSIVGAVLLLVGWVAALFLGRLPEPIFRFMSQLVGYNARVLAYLLLLTDRYPPFQLSAEDYPVRVELAPGRLNRLAVLFRIFLLIPAEIVATLVLCGLYLAGFFIWLLVLVLGRVPGSLFDAITAVARYTVRYSSYAWLLTPAYPGGLFGDPPAPPAPGQAAGQVPASSPVLEAAAPVAPGAPGDGSFAGPAEGPEPVGPARRLVLSAGAKRLVVLFLVLGVAAWVAGGVVGVIVGANTTSNAETLATVTAAHDTLASRGQKFQQDINACSSVADAQRLSCAQAADRDLAAAFEAFATTVEGLEVPSEARAEAAAVGRIGHQFAAAMQGLVSASSPEEYTRLAANTDQLGNSFDQRYQALVNELAS